MMNSRRDFLKATAATGAVAGTLAGMSIPAVHAGEDNTITLALVGCGGRGTGAVINALAVANEFKLGPVKLVAMADVFENRMRGSYDNLESWCDENMPDAWGVTPDTRFVGFDGYQKAIASLKPNGIVISATPPAFRGMHFAAALERGDVHAFLEKPFAVDGPTQKAFLETVDKSEKTNMKVGTGLMSRHCRSRQALKAKVEAGELGDVISLRAYRMHGPIGYHGPQGDGEKDMMYQIRNFHSFLWASGGCFMDFYVHNIDECCWMKGMWPVSAQAMGGTRMWGPDGQCQNFDHYGIEYTFPDGTKLWFQGRDVNNTWNEFRSFMHCTKGAAMISDQSHGPHSAIWANQTMDGKPTWEMSSRSPYEWEWLDLLTAIRKDEKYNVSRRSAMGNLAALMGRFAAHTGQWVTPEFVLNHPVKLIDNIPGITEDTAAPVSRGADGLFPLPQPGRNKAKTEDGTEYFPEF